MISRKLRFALSLFLIIIGTILLTVNILGFYIYTSVDNNNENLLMNDHRLISEKNFWNSAYKKDDEAPGEYINRLTNLVSKYMLMINPENCKPTIFENWILHFYSQELGFYEWSDTKKAVQLGGGFCSQHALLFNNLLQSQGIESRILASSGHILNEVKIDGKWKVVDPTFNVISNYSLNELEGHPQRVYQIYKSSTKDEYLARYVEKLFEKAGSHRTIKNSQVYRQRDYNIEQKSFYLIWLIPLVFLILGLATLKRTAS